ncbi:ABC transporter ATP-binding protein [Sphaerotilus mobilis]|uniref:Putative ABC transport system ATP-binding protein n=1 Tax=Sphaerotilus mobilis TaxID=47994 RepID=A0A4Q7LGJ3_9BURK|nr:ATP-binding cassette domain-containing protein [Sphaerotilus mobilis]RZS53212.1 putative ABC transport system ATP-binding protein [Sphaerotilus mobilis]
MSSALVRLTEVRHGWPGQPRDVLDIATLELPAGQTAFVRGPSGCGKSTLLALLAGVQRARAGRVDLLGQDWAGLSASACDRRRADHIGIVFQQFNLLPYLSVLDNVLLPCRLSALRAQRAGADAARRERAALDLLDRVGLRGDLVTRRADRLSVGQQQRVAAARALIGAPELVLADEPTSALDEARRDAFMDLLLGACAEAGSTLVFVSHDARLAPRFDHVIDLPTLNRAPQQEVA